MSMNYELIQSDQNQWLKRCKALQQKKYRQQYQQFVAEGLRFVQEAIENQAATIAATNLGYRKMVLSKVTAFLCLIV